MKKQNAFTAMILGLERTARWSIFLITVSVMFYLIVHSLMRHFAYPIGSIPPAEARILITDSYLPLWKGFRNLLYMLLVIHIPLLGIATFIRERSVGIKQAIMPVAAWSGLLVFVAFSYALAFFIRDLVIVAQLFIIGISQ